MMSTIPFCALKDCEVTGYNPILQGKTLRSLAHGTKGLGVRPGFHAKLVDLRGSCLAVTYCLTWPCPQCTRNITEPDHRSSALPPWETAAEGLE